MGLRGKWGWEENCEPKKQGEKEKRIKGNREKRNKEQKEMWIKGRREK